MSTEDFVARGLRSLGLDVQPIPVGATKTPDFRVSDGTQTYLLEVKDKFPDSDSIRRREKALDLGGIWEEETELAYQNALSCRPHRPPRPRSPDAPTRRGRWPSPRRPRAGSPTRVSAATPDGPTSARWRAWTPGGGPPRSPTPPR